MPQLWMGLGNAFKVISVEAVNQIPWEAICTRYGHSCFVDKLSSQLGPCTPYLAVP